MLQKLFIVMSLGLLLGTSAYAQRSSQVIEVWGGDGVEIAITRNFAANLEFDCATGTVQAGRWPVNQTRINAVGMVTRLDDGDGRTQRPTKSTFKANIDATKGLMTLSVKVGNERAVVYKLVKGRAGDIRSCL